MPFAFEGLPPMRSTTTEALSSMTRSTTTLAMNFLTRGQFESR